MMIDNGNDNDDGGMEMDWKVLKMKNLHLKNHPFQIKEKTK